MASSGTDILATSPIGSLLKKNLLKAVEMASKQHQVANDFTTTFPQETTRAWRCMVKNWEANASYPNPYILKEHGRFSPTPRNERVSPFSFASIEGFQGMIATHSGRGRRGSKGERIIPQGLRISFHTHGT